MSKKAQGLSMTVIIVAAIALLVLVILAVIFIGKMGNTARSIDQCKGSCVADIESCNERPYHRVVAEPCYVTGTKDLDDSNPICCIGV